MSDITSDPLAVDRIVSSVEKRQQLTKDVKPSLIPTGFRGLDALVGGVRAGEMVVVGGKRKNGKTLVCQTLTERFRKQGVNSVWFSYEVPIDQFLEQMLENTLFYLPNVLTKNAMDWVQARCLEARDKFNCQIVFLDHLHYLIDMVKLRNPSLEIGAIVRGLKRMAIDLKLIVFLISHVRGTEVEVEITEDHLRDSSMTAAEADTTWIVSRLFDKADEATNICRLTVRNHRRTGVMAKSIKLIKIGTFFEEYVEGMDEMQAKGQLRSFYEPGAD